MARNSTVINACFSLNIAPVAVPRYRAVNEEVVKLDLDFGDSFSGVLVDGQDHLRALWASDSEQVVRHSCSQQQLQDPACNVSLALRSAMAGPHSQYTGSAAPSCIPSAGTGACQSDRS